MCTKNYESTLYICVTQGTERIINVRCVLYLELLCGIKSVCACLELVFTIIIREITITVGAPLVRSVTLGGLSRDRFTGELALSTAAEQRNKALAT